jgi:hypothetical protein
MISNKFTFIFIAIVFSVVEGNKPTETNEEVIKRNKDINQVLGKYSGAMIEKQSETEKKTEYLLRSLRTIKLAFANCNGQHIQGAITAFSNCKRFQEVLAVSDMKPLNEKRYQDINQAFGQYSGAMIGKRSVAETKESDEVIKRYQDINQAFGQYSGPMIGKRFQSEDKSEDSIKSTKAIKQVFGQYSGPLVGDIKIVNPIVNKSKESVASKRYLQINRAHGTYAGSYVSPTDVTYETCLSLAKVNLFTPTYTSVVSKPVVYSSVPVTVGGLYTGDMYGKRSTADVIQSCKQKYPNLPITSVSNVITPYVSTNTNTNYNSNVYSSDWKGLFSVFDSFPYIFGKRDVADLE